MLVVYFSNISDNTHRFVHKLSLEKEPLRIPVRPKEAPLFVYEPFVLITPTYGAAGKNFVPMQVKKFLNVEEHRKLIRGVIAAGNTNFGRDFGVAGNIISQKINIPLMYKFELMGTPEDVKIVENGIGELK